MSKYELMLILDPRLSDDDKTSNLTELKDLFSKHSINIEKEDIWWEKKLAYKINNLNNWYYILFDLEMEGKLIKDLSKTINLNKNILRYMFVKKED